MLRIGLVWLALLMPAGVSASEGRVTGADIPEIRAAVFRRIAAFHRDDACRAAYRPASISFLEIVLMGDEVVQRVQLIDRAGGVWVAYYAMQRQGDGSWRTHGCRLVSPVRIISA